MAGDPRSKAAALRRQAAAIEEAMNDADRVTSLVAAHHEARQSAQRAAERAARAVAAAKTSRLAAETSRQNVVAALRDHLQRGLPPSLAEAVFGVSPAIVASAREDGPTSVADKEPGEGLPAAAEMWSA